MTIGLTGRLVAVLLPTFNIYFTIAEPLRFGYTDVHRYHCDHNLKAMFSEPSYLAARMAAETIETHFAEHLAAARNSGETYVATALDARIIESVIDTAFWASLRREEGHSPAISLALLMPEEAGKPLIFGQRLRLTPNNLVKLAPAVEQPGIHLGVWHENDELYIWGTTHTVPGICFVLEVVEPGLLVVKHKRLAGFGKFVNVAVLQGDQIKVLDERSMGIGECPALMASLMNMSLPSLMGESFNILIQLAAAVRIHRRGGLVLIVPRNSETWQHSIVHPIKYAVTPPYTVLADLMEQDDDLKETFEWQEQLLQAIDIIGGFTAVDGATVITQQYDLLAFGAKVARSAVSVPVEQIIMTEPVAGVQATRIHPAQNGGTRHLAAAQFVHDQHDALALVASQDGQFTVFAWSEKLQMVHAHRIDVLLL